MMKNQKKIVGKFEQTQLNFGWLFSLGFCGLVDDNIFSISEAFCYKNTKKIFKIFSCGRESFLIFMKSFFT